MIGAELASGSDTEAVSWNFNNCNKNNENYIPFQGKFLPKGQCSNVNVVNHWAAGYSRTTGMLQLTIFVAKHRSCVDEAHLVGLCNLVWCRLLWMMDLEGQIVCLIELCNGIVGYFLHSKDARGSKTRLDQRLKSWALQKMVIFRTQNNAISFLMILQSFWLSCDTFCDLADKASGLSNKDIYIW